VELKKIIKSAVKDNKVIIGYNRVMKEIKTKKLKLVVCANNIPKDKLDDIIYNAKLSGVNVEKYPDDNVNLGLFCGKPFLVTVLAIEGSKNDNSI